MHIGQKDHPMHKYCMRSSFFEDQLLEEFMTDYPTRFFVNTNLSII